MLSGRCRAPRTDDFSGFKSASAPDALEDGSSWRTGPSPKVSVVPPRGSETQRNKTIGTAMAAKDQRRGIVAFPSSHRLSASAPPRHPERHRRSICLPGPGAASAPALTRRSVVGFLREGRPAAAAVWRLTAGLPSTSEDAEVLGEPQCPCRLTGTGERAITGERGQPTAAGAVGRHQEDPGA